MDAARNKVLEAWMDEHQHSANRLARAANTAIERILSFRAGCRQGESGCGEASIDDVAAVLDFAECSPQDAHQVLGVGEGNVVLARAPSQ